MSEYKEITKHELVNFIKDNVKGPTEIERQIIIGTELKGSIVIFNFLPFNNTITCNDNNYKYFKPYTKVDNLNEFIEELDMNFNIIFAMHNKERIPYYYKNINLDDIMTLPEATLRWGLADSTLRRLLTTDKLIEGIEYKRSGKSALITKRAMRKIYGNPKGE